MKLTMSTTIFLVSILMFSIVIAKFTNLIATDITYNPIFSKNVTFDKLKKYDIDDSSNHLMWFVQITDLHISIFKDLSRISQFEEFCKTTVNIINPPVVLASGDLTDAKTADSMGSRQFISEWEEYKRVLDNTGIIKRTIWLDVRGNHDNFNVLNAASPENYFRNYSIQGKQHIRSYMHEISMGSDKFAFIAIDACREPGIKRPFNFIGLLKKNDFEQVEKFAEESHRHKNDYIIWFGHYPTSSIMTPSRTNVRNTIGKYRESMAYLCGHYHTLGGIAPHMYTLQREGFLEVELADWKDNRMYRLAAIDHGQFSFVDIKHGQWPVILITNPKHLLYKMPLRENLQSIVESTHIRILVFSNVTISTVEVRIDHDIWWQCHHVKGPLYVFHWNPLLYNVGIHYIRVRVIDVNNTETEIAQPFSLDGSNLSFDFIPRFVLMLDATSVFAFNFAISLILNMAMLSGMRVWHQLYMNRSRRSRDKAPCTNKYLVWLIRPLWIQASINRLFYPQVLYLLYLLIGPWAIGEVIEGQIGIIFPWGIYVGNTFLPGSLTFAYGFLQLISFHIPLTIILAMRVETIFQIHASQLRQRTYFNQTLRNLPFVFLCVLQLIMIYYFWLAYGTMATILCPLRTWSLIMGVILFHHARLMPVECFRGAVRVWGGWEDYQD